jgi:SPP1 family phage portal protein
MLNTEKQIELINTAMRYSLLDNTKREAKVAERYYEGQHDILKYKLFYIDSDGSVQEDKTRSNIKISHPFFPELVDQLVQYMLSGIDDGYITSSDPKIQELMDKQFNNNDDFNAQLNFFLTGVSKKGSEYMYVYKNDDGLFVFEDVDSEGVQEVRARDTDDKCAYLVRWYVDRVDKDGEQITKIELWDDSQTYYFIKEGLKEIQLDRNVEQNPRPHIIINDGKDRYGEGFGFIPFFRMDNNKKKMSDLHLIKALIDDYDLMSCSLSNNLQDFVDGLWVVKGFTGDNMDELIKNIKTKKAVGVDTEGDVDLRTISIPFEARKTKMELDEKNIYRFGMGFNSSQIGDGNVTNVVIKSRYTLLDLKANKLEIRLKAFIRELVKVVLDDYNKENETAFEISDVKIAFKRETISNDTDNAQIALTKAQEKQTLIDTLANLNGILDTETYLKLVCEVLDVSYEEIKDKAPIQTDDAEDLLEGDESSDGEEVVDKAEDELGHSLNGSQTQSLLNVIAQWKAGTLSEAQAISVISLAVGISREKAGEILKES